MWKMSGHGFGGWKKKRQLAQGATFSSLILLLFFGCFLAQGAEAADTPAQEMGAAGQAMSEAGKELREAGEDFSKSFGGSQKTGAKAWSELPAQSAGAGGQGASAAGMSDPANPALHGSPETGYAGTWTDPATGDIITSVIAPTPQATQSSQNYPIIIEPNVGNWSSSGGSGVVWGGGLNPQWPTTPDNPGWGGAPTPPPPPPTPSYPPAMGAPGQNFYPSPSLPPNFNPSYRPLHPQRPPAWGNSGQGWNPPPGQGWQPGGNTGQPGGGQGWNPPPNQGGAWQPGGSGGQGWNPPPSQGGSWQPPSPGWNPPSQGGAPGNGWSRPPANGAMPSGGWGGARGWNRPGGFPAQPNSARPWRGGQ